MTKEQTFTLDMIYIHQGWHRECGIVMGSTEKTQAAVNYLSRAGYVVQRDDGWYKILDKGVKALAIWRNSLKKEA